MHGFALNTIPLHTGIAWFACNTILLHTGITWFAGREVTLRLVGVVQRRSGCKEASERSSQGAGTFIVPAMFFKPHFLRYIYMYIVCYKEI